MAVVCVALSACGSGESQSDISDKQSSDTRTSLSGEILYKRCSACHNISKDGGNGIGPNLWGVVGSSIAGRSDFGYSKSLSSKEGVWDEASLDAFLRSPQGFVPGTKMSFAGIRQAEDRATLIEYLSQKSD